MLLVASYPQIRQGYAKGFESQSDNAICMPVAIGRIRQILMDELLGGLIHHI